MSLTLEKKKRLIFRGKKTISEMSIKAVQHFQLKILKFYFISMGTNIEK